MVHWRAFISRASPNDSCQAKMRACRYTRLLSLPGLTAAFLAISASVIWSSLGEHLQCVLLYAYCLGPGPNLHRSASGWLRQTTATYNIVYVHTIRTLLGKQWLSPSTFIHSETPLALPYLSKSQCARFFTMGCRGNCYTLQGDGACLIDHNTQSRRGTTWYFCPLHRVYHAIHTKNPSKQPLCGECAVLFFSLLPQAA